MFFLSFLAIIMRGQRTVRERSKYFRTVLSTESARVRMKLPFTLTNCLTHGRKINFQ